MSKENITTTPNSRSEQSDDWTTTRGDEFRTKLKAAVRNGENPLESYKGPEKVDSVYSFKAEDLFERGVMVIDPFERLVTQEPTDETTTPVATDGTEASKSTSAPKSTTKAPVNPAQTTPYATFGNTSEKTPGFVDRMRNRISAALGNVAARLEKVTKDRKDGRVKNGLANAANRLMQFANRTAPVAAGETTEQTTPLTESEKAKVERKEKKEPRKSLREKLGNLAVVKMWKDLPDDPKDTNDSKTDGFFKRVGNNIKNNERSKKGVKGHLGRTAMTSAVILATAGAFLAPGYLAAKKAEERGDFVNAGVVYGIEQTEGMKTTVVTVGGNTQHRPAPDMVEKAQHKGVNVEGLDWNAEMGLGGGGKAVAESSLVDGSTALAKRMNELVDAGQEAQIMSYSWGTVATAQMFHDLKHSDPELYAKLKPPVLYGSPFGPNGGFNGRFGNIAMQMFGVDPAIRDSLPRGTTFVYSERDPYATSGDGQQPLTAGFNVLMMGLGSHGAQNEADAYITVEDDNGNFHKITRFDAAAALGIKGPGNAELNAAINALFPVNNDPDSKVRPRADAIAAMFYGAQALDKMIDPTGTVKIFEKIQAQVPAEWKKLLDNGMNGINDATVAVMDAVNNPTPENIQKAFNAVLSTIGMVSGDLQAALNRNVTTDIKNGGVTVASQLVAENFNMDYNTVHQQFSMFANQIEQSAKNFATQQAAEAQARAQARATAAATVSTPSVSQIPSATAPTVTIPTNIAPDVPRATYNNPAPADAPKAVVAEAPKPAQAPVVEQAAPPAQSAPTPAAQPAEAPVVIPPAPAPAEAPAPAAPAPVEAPAAPARVAEVPAPQPAPVAPVNPFQGILDRLAPPAAPAPAPASPAPSVEATTAPEAPSSAPVIIPQATAPAAASDEPAN